MTKRFVWLFLCVILIFVFPGNLLSQEDGLGVMRPDDLTRQKWYEAYESAPKAYIDEALKVAPPASKSLLSYLYYIPAERHQHSCGNCWAWAGTGVMSIDLYRQTGILDRLSVQYNNSCQHSGGPGCGYGCCGGWLSELADFYNDPSFDQALPWVNDEAEWQDGGTGCTSPCTSSTGHTTVPCGDIDTTPNYPVTSMTAVTIPTTGEFETPIQNIKNVLNQNKAVWFGFFMPTKADGDSFKNFWSYQGENVTWNPDYSCYHTWNNGWGHAVLIVGYNDTDPSNSYWVVVNSWGDAGGNRPNGIFRLDMNMNYNCEYWDAGAGEWKYSFLFQTADITWGEFTRPHACCNTGPEGCIDPEIKTEICEADSYCCDGYWDSICVGEVESVYGDNCDCCEVSTDAEGCYRSSSDEPMLISDCVCAADPYCCNYRWDSICVNEVESLSCGCCAPGTPTSPLPKNGATNVPLDATLSWGGSGAAAPSDINRNETVASGIVDPDSVAPPTAFGAEEREIERVEILDEMNSNKAGATEVPAIEPDSAAVKAAVDCACGGKYYTGAKVIALVDNPSNATGILKGHTGTVICGKDAGLPILISWDDWTQGHDGNGLCECPVTAAPADSAWWVNCEEIGVIAVDCACGGEYATGDRVYATVDNPASASGILAGHPGRVVCGDTGGGLEILISWDDWSEGHDGNGYCECPVSDAPDNSGWWVHCTDIAKCPVTYTVYFGTTGPTSIICSNISSPSCDPGPLSGNTKYYWSVVAKVPGAETVGPTWSFTTASLGDPCECDLNGDGSCNGLDWLLFYPDWGRKDCNDPGTQACECDLNGDGSCNGLDWLLFYPDWGRKDCP